MTSPTPTVRALALKFLGFLIALAILPPVLLIGIVTKGWRKYFQVEERPLPPKMLEDPQWGTHQYVHLPGLKMHYVEKGDRSKPLIIFLHGFPAFWFTWRHQLTHFSEDYWCVAVDMRGFGDTEKPTGIDAYSMDKAAADVANLARSLGRERFLLVGHDWGGVVGYRVCARYPSMVKCFVPCNIPHGRAWQRAMNNGWGQMLKSWYVFFFQCPLLPERFLRWGDLAIIDSCFQSMKADLRGGAAKEEVECYKFTFRDRGAFAGPLNYYRHALQCGGGGGGSAEDPEVIGRQVSVLQVWGTGDRALDLSSARASRDFVEDLEEVYLDGVSHWAHMEAPNKVNEAIERHLTERAAW